MDGAAEGATSNVWTACKYMCAVQEAEIIHDRFMVVSHLGDCEQSLAIGEVFTALSTPVAKTRAIMLVVRKRRRNMTRG